MRNTVEVIHPEAEITGPIGGLNVGRIIVRVDGVTIAVVVIVIVSMVVGIDIIVVTIAIVTVVGSECVVPI